MMQEIEQWADIPDYEGLYQVSNQGRVRSLIRLLDSAHFEGKRKEKKILKFGYSMQGRKQVNLCKDGIVRRFLVNRLVLISFRGEPPFPKAESRHMDGDHLNNHLWNLEWGTHAQNMQDKTRHGTQTSMQGENHPNARLDENCVRAIRALELPERTIAEMYGVSQVTIHFIRTRKTWKHVN